MMSNRKRLHPAAMIFTVITTLRQLIFAALPIIILTIGDGYYLYALLGVSVFAVFIIGYSILSWFRYSYAIVGDELRIEQGIFIRKKRSISKNRIQSIDLTQGIIHRIFGLTKVQIETAGSDRKVDASLSAVLFEEGQLLHKELKRKGEALQEETNDQEENYFKHAISFKRLLIAGSTSGSFGVILSLGAIAFSELESFIPETVYNEVTVWFVNQAIEIIIVLSVIVLIILWVLGTLGTVIKYGKFTITRYENELFITRGLLEKRQMTIPLKRIQAIGIKETLIRQPLGYATLFVEIAGGDTEENKVTETLLFPLLKKNEVSGFLQEILPEYNSKVGNLTRLPIRSLPYYLFSTLIIPLIGLIVVFILWPKWVIIPVVLVVVAAFLGYFQHHTTGFMLTDEQLTVQMRLFNKETILVKRHRIQSMVKRQHFLYRKQNLGLLAMSILNNYGGNHYAIKGMELSDIDKIVDWYSYSNKLEKDDKTSIE